MASNPVADVPDIEFIVDWQSLTPAHAAAIKAFWQRMGALTGRTDTEERLAQVVMHAQDAAGTVVAVCTADRSRIPKLKEWLYFYRSFVSPAWRKHGVAITLLIRSSRFLADFARANNFPCVGILLAIESKELSEISSLPYWPRTQFTFIGRDPKQNKCYVRYFDGARLSG